MQELLEHVQVQLLREKLKLLLYSLLDGYFRLKREMQDHSNVPRYTVEWV